MSTQLDNSVVSMKPYTLPYQKQCWPFHIHTVTKLEILTYCVTVPLGMIWFLDPQNLWGLLIPGFFFVLLSFCWWYFGGLYFLFFSQFVLRQFRSMVVLLTLFCMFVLDFSSFYFQNDEYKDRGKDSIMISVFDDIFWSLVIFLLIQGDTVYPKPSNFSRLLLPLYATCNCVWVIYKSIAITAKYDVVLIHYDYGNITFHQLWRAVFMQLIWFLTTATFSVFNDTKHLYCIWSTGPLLRKDFLIDIPYHQYTHLFCPNTTISTDLFFISFFILYIPITLLYVFQTVFGAVFSVILCLMLLYNLVVLLYNHFQFNLIKLLFKQFRSQLLMVSIVLLIYCLLQRIIWNIYYHKKEWNATIVINETCFQIALCIAVLLLLLRDIIIHKFPNWFTISMVAWTFTISCIKIFENTFFSNILVYPSWFILLEKEALFQMGSMSLLVLYKLFKDPKHSQFVLIRKKMKRSYIFDYLVQSKPILQDVHNNETFDGFALLSTQKI